MQLKPQAMGTDKPKTSRNRTPIAAHRRVGLFSLACLVLGGGWVGFKVLPGLQKAAESGKVQTAGMGWLHFLPGTASPKPSPSAPPQLQKDQEAPAIGTVEATMVDAPVGTALQGLLASARYTSVCDPSVVSQVTYSNAGKPKPFWEIVGRVIGAAPAPSAHVVPYWDAYRILPRNVIPMGQGMAPAMTNVTIAPVPASEIHPSHRMAGYIVLNPNGSRPPIRAAILETRIPGEVPHWHVVFVGDAIMRKSSIAVSRETDPRQNIDVVPVVEAIESDHLILRGGGEKRLRVPLSKTGVPDVFGFRKEDDDPATPQTFNPGPNERLNTMQSSEVY